MYKHCRHLMYPSVITKTHGLMSIGSRALTQETVLVGAVTRRSDTNQHQDARVAIEPRTRGLMAASSIRPRPFAFAHSGIDILPMPGPVLAKFKAFYDAVDVTGIKPPLPGLEYMGWGYNVFGTYAEAGQLKWPLVDLVAQPLVACAHPYESFQTVDFVKPSPPLLKAMTNSFLGMSSLEYASSMSAKAGLTGMYNGFVGSVHADFNQEEITSSANVLIRTRTVVGELALHLDVPKFKNALSAEARADLDGAMTPHDLFDKYGGYFVSGIIVGGKAYRTWLANRYAFSSTNSLQVDAELSFMKLIGLSGGTTSQSSAHFESVAISENMTTMGGDPELGGGRIMEPGGLGRWMDTIGENPVFVDFTDPQVWHPLTPIWELCTSTTRKNQLQAAWNLYTSEQPTLPPVQLSRLDYGIGIQTSRRDDAGTDANVSIELIGQNGRRSGLLHLGNHPALFERGSQDYFVKQAMDVGELIAIRLVHDNAGHKPGWYVDLVRVTCLERIWEFPVNHWLAKDEDPHRTDITFDLAGQIID